MLYTKKNMKSLSASEVLTTSTGQDLKVFSELGCSVQDVGATTGVLACFQMGFYFVTTGGIFEIGLCENSTQTSITCIVV